FPRNRARQSGCRPSDTPIAFMGTRGAGQTHHSTNTMEAWMSKVRTGKKPAEEKQPTTYQDALDESLQETFPASDPISPSVGNTGRRISTEKNPADWQLKRGSAAKGEDSTAAGGDSSAARDAEMMPTTAVRGDAGLDDIYHELQRGVGRELVTD